MDTDLLILSYANKETQFKHNLEITLKRQNYNYKFIGTGEVWKGFINKIIGYRNALLPLKDNKNLIICLIDSSDVFATPMSKPSTLLSSYLLFSKEIVFGSESHCGDACKPVVNYWKVNNPKNTSNVYLNSGFIIGTSNALFDLFDFMYSKSYTDDQIGCCDYVNLNPTKVALDIYSLLCANIVGNDVVGNSYSFKDGRIKNKRTNTYPSFIHLPGSKVDLFLRYRYYGKRILKNQFQFIPLKEEVKVYFNTLNKRMMIIKLMVITLSILLLIKCPKILILLITILVGMYIFYYYRLSSN
jgi:hypothetical protein